jgi:hypothetical protein
VSHSVTAAAEVECGFVTRVGKMSIGGPCDNIQKFKNHKQRLAQVFRHTLSKRQILHILFIGEQEVLGRTNRLLSFHTTRMA